jgi:hypothetical protein
MYGVQPPQPHTFAWCNASVVPMKTITKVVDVFGNILYEVAHRTGFVRG